jgi:hypothetical protein
MSNIFKYISMSNKEFALLKSSIQMNGQLSTYLKQVS